MLYLVVTLLLLLTAVTAGGSVVQKLARTFPQRKSCKSGGTWPRRVYGADRSFCQLHAWDRNRLIGHSPRHYRSLCEGQMKAYVLLAAALPILLLVGCTGGRETPPYRVATGGNARARQESNSVRRVRRVPHDSRYSCRSRRTGTAAEFVQPPHHDRRRTSEYARQLGSLDRESTVRGIGHSHAELGSR